MKILRAEKFQPKKRSTKKQKTKLRKADWDALMQHDRLTGKLNLMSAAILKDPGAVKRLLEANMIDPDGKLTPEARQKCSELSGKIQKPETAGQKPPEMPKEDNARQVVGPKIEKLTASDWAVLMKYDSKTGNILKYDSETGQLDNTSHAILKDPAIIQRLIDNNIILPGGWLTPEAKKECARIEEKLKAQAADGYTESKNDEPKTEVESESNPEPLIKSKPKSMGEQLSKVYAERESNAVYSGTKSHLEHSSKDGRQDRPDPNTEPLSKAEPQPKGHLDPEAKSLSDKLSKTYASRQHYPDPEVSTELKPGEPSEKAPENETKTKNLTDPNLQTFFEQLPVDHPEPLSKGENLPHENPERRLKGEKTKKSMETGETLVKETASIRTLRRFDLKTVSKPEGEDEERPKRKKKDSGGMGGETTEPPRFSLRDVFHIIFKRRLQIFICFFFIVCMAIIATLLMNPVYEASAQILVKLGRESVFVPTAGNVTPILNINREQQVNSEIEILKSRSLAEKVVAALGPTVIYKSLAEEKSGILNFIFPDSRRELTPDERKAADFESAVAGFMKALSVTGIKKSNVIQVSFKNEDPRMAAKVVNNLSNMYLGHHLAVHKTPQNVKFFQEQTDLLKNKLDQAEEKLKALRKQHNITSLEEQRSLLLGRSSALNSGLNQTISQEVETEKRIRLLRRQLASVPETVSQGEESDQNQNPYLINTLEARLVELQLKEKGLLNKYTDQSRLVQNVKEEIRVVEQKLEEQSTKRYGRKTSGRNPTYQRLKEELFSNEAELEALKAKKITQKQHLVGLQVNLENLNQVELELNQLEQKIEVDRENYRLYLSKVEESRISEAMDSEKIASVSLIGPARSPRTPISPKVKLNILIGIFLGTFGSLSLALFREYLDDRIEKIEDVETELQLPVLASIPIFEKKAAGV